MLPTYSRLTQKLSQRFLFIYTILFAFLSVIILSGSVILLIHQTRQSSEPQIRILSDTVNSYQKELFENSYLLTSSQSLDKDIESYLKTPDTSTYARINLQLSNFLASNSMIQYLSMQCDDGTLFHSLNSLLPDMQDFLDSQSHYQELLTRNSTYFSPVITLEDSDSASFCYYLSKQTLHGHTFLITICYDAYAFVRSLSTGSLILDNIVIYNNQLDVLWTSSQNIFQDSPSFLTASSSNVRHILDRKGLHFYLSNYDSDTYIVGTVFWGVLIKNFALIAACLLLLYFIPLAAALLYLIPVNEKLLAPIVSLAADVQNFSLGDSAVEIYETHDEIEDLSHAFHDMTQNITQQAGELAAQERKEAITHYKLLATQTDPHFIYNTMNIINILARQHAYQDIIQVNTALTQVLRERLNTQNRIFETVEKEVHALRQYQLIMEYRYHNLVSFDYDIDPAVMQYFIPKNILQPLAENSYYHGLTREDGTISGNIGLVIYEMNEEIIIEFSDDGIGISPEHLEKITSTLHSTEETISKDAVAHIGIENIYRRVQYLYQDNFFMDIQSIPQHGTTISLSLPLMPPQETDQTDTF